MLANAQYWEEIDENEKKMTKSAVGWEREVSGIIDEERNSPPPRAGSVAVTKTPYHWINEIYENSLRYQETLYTAGKLKLEECRLYCVRRTVQLQNWTAEHAASGIAMLTWPQTTLPMAIPDDSLRVVAERYILQQNCLKKWIGGSALPGTRRYRSWTPQYTSSQTDGQTADDSIMPIVDHTIRAAVGSAKKYLRKEKMNLPQ